MKYYVLLFAFSSIFFTNCKEESISKTSEQGLKEINGTQLYCRVEGSGEPILIIHGGPGLSHDYLFKGINTLSDHHKLIFYDQRASGQSSINLDYSSVSLENFIQDIESLRKEFGIKKINLMAHSWGGVLAMKYAIQFPENMKSLILVNSIGASSDSNNMANLELVGRFTKKDSVERAEIFASEAFQKREPIAIESLMNLGFKHQFYDSIYIDSLQLSLNQNFIQTSGLLQNLGKDLTKFDFVEDLKSIQCPTLLVYGDYDPLTDLAGRITKDAIKGSKIQIIKNCGHFPFIEKNEAFKSTIINFMADIK